MLLAFDLDNTIITKDYSLPEAIKESLFAAKQAGHHVSVLTGRPPSATHDFLKQLELTEFYSCNHGANVYGKNAELIREVHLDVKTMHSVLDPYLHDPQVEYACIAQDTLYVRNPKDERWNWAHTQSRRVEVFHGELDLKAEKIVLSSEDQSERIRAQVTKAFPNLITYAWNNNYIEVSSENSDKGSALALLAKQLGYSAKDTIAFGDGPNDQSMLEWAGYAVAVGPEAHAEVLKAADIHIESPENNGVKNWIEQNLLS